MQLTKTKILAGTAIFSALAYAVSWLEFAVFPAAGFLKLDFSNVFAMLAGFMYGPVAGIGVSAVKELLCFLTKSSSGGIGEIANFIMTTAFIILPSVMYKVKKGFKWVVLYLAAACVLQTAVALITNRYINFPLYAGASAVAMFNELWVYVLAFNVIKSVVISVITIILYKHVSRLFDRI